MGTEMANIDATALSKLATNEQAILSARSLTDLDPEHVHALTVLADGPPPPALSLATQDEFKALMKSLGTTLKQPQLPLDEGRWKLSTYWGILGHLPLAALQHATRQALTDLEWMPAPSQLLAYAESYGRPDQRLYQRARFLVREHRQAEWQRQCRAIERKEIVMSDLSDLDDALIEWGIAQRYLIKLPPDDTLVYLTGETLAAWQAAQTDERPVARAREGSEA